MLNLAGLAVLRELWHWRENDAVAANRPPFFILAHEKLVAIAAATAGNDSVERHFPRHLSPRRREGVVKAIKAAQARSPDSYPDVLRNRVRRPSEAERRRYHELEERRDAVAHHLGIDATIIASRSVLSDLARDWDKHASELMKWQLQLLQG